MGQSPEGPLLKGDYPVSRGADGQNNILSKNQILIEVVNPKLLLYLLPSLANCCIALETWSPIVIFILFLHSLFAQQVSRSSPHCLGQFTQFF